MPRTVTTQVRRARPPRRARRFVAGLASGLALLAGSALIAAPAGASSGARTADPGGPLSCTPGKIVMKTGAGISYGNFGAGTIAFTPAGQPVTALWNTTGYNPLDGYLYGVSLEEPAGTLLYRFGNDGSMTTVGTLSPGVGTTNSGGFDDAGNFYVLGQPDLDVLKKINVTTLQTTTIQLSGRVRAPDLAYMGGYLWGVGSDGITGLGVLYRIDLSTGNVIQTKIAGLPVTQFQAGGAFAYPNGDLGFFVQTLGQLIRVSVTNPSSSAPGASLVSSQATTFASGDAAACLTAVTDLGLDVSSPAAAAPNTPIDFTLTVTNKGPNPSSGWSLNAPIPAGVTNPTTSTPGCTITGGMLSCTGGELGSGDFATVQVTLTGPATGSVNLEGTVSANDTDTSNTNDVDDSTTEISPEAGVPMLDPTAGGILFGGAVLAACAVLFVRTRRRSALR